LFLKNKAVLHELKKPTSKHIPLLKFRSTLSATTQRNTEHTITSGITTCGAVDGTAASGT